MKVEELFLGNKSLLGMAAELNFLFLLKAWKIMSDRNGLDTELTFDTVYNKTIDLKEMNSIFKQLSKNVNIFKIFLAFYKEIPFDNVEDVIKLFNLIANNRVGFSVMDAYDSLNALSAKSYTVSSQLTTLGYKLLNNDSKEIYIPFTNTFSVFSVTNKKVYFENAYDSSYVTSTYLALILEYIKIIENKDIEYPKPTSLMDIAFKDPLVNPEFLNPNAPHLLRQFDSVLSFPPLSLKKEFDTSRDRFHRFQFQKGAVLDIAHFEHILAQTKSKAVVLMPVGLTYRAGNEEKFRQYLIENNWLEAIIQLPPNLHNATSIETTFFVINKQKNDEKVLFINLKDESFIKRDGRKLVLKSLDKILDIYKNKKEIEAISSQVTNEEIVNNSYSYAIDRYIISKEAKELQKRLEQFELVNLEDIADIKRSQLFRDEEEGKEVYEVSPSDFNKAGYTLECGKVKKIGSQYTRLHTYKLEPYDVLLSTKGTIGKVAIIGEISDAMIASQAIQVIRIKSEDKKNKAIALYMFFKSKLGQTILSSLVAGVAMPQIATAEIKKLGIPILTKEQEKQIILNFNSEVKLYNEIEKLNKDIEQIHNNFLGNR
jgi:type I restriction enzyme M protein